MGRACARPGQRRRRRARRSDAGGGPRWRRVSCCWCATRCVLPPRAGPQPRGAYRLPTHPGRPPLPQWARGRLPAPGARGGAGLRRALLARGRRWHLLDPHRRPGASGALPAGRAGAGWVPSRTNVPRPGGATVSGAGAARAPPASGAAGAVGRHRPPRGARAGAAAPPGGRSGGGGRPERLPAGPRGLDPGLAGPAPPAARQRQRAGRAGQRPQRGAAPEAARDAGGERSSDALAALRTLLLNGGWERYGQGRSLLHRSAA